MAQQKIILTGNDLTLAKIEKFVRNSKCTIDISAPSYHAIEKSRKFLEREYENRIIYGVNTGFGPMASHIVSKENLAQLQLNLILSHAVGMGGPLSDDYVLSAMLVRLNTLIKGFSGISVQLADHFAKFLNHRIIPIVPEHGAVGTSGDLVQLAHIALALLGKGEVYYMGKKLRAKKILRDLRIKPYTLKIKEGLALINGTSMMSGIAALNCLRAQRLLDIAVRAGAFGIELANGYNDSTAERLHRLRPHPGQIAIAKLLRSILATSQMRRTRRSLHDIESQDNGTEKVHEIPKVVQEIYSFRCISQILGPVYDTLQKTKREVETEINSVTDNPIVDWETNNFLHGGNFHGEYIASGMDQLKMVITKLTILSERRLNFFLHHKINGFLPPFINIESPGLTLGLQGLQFVATSTASQSQTLSFPQSVHSISTNADNQDVISMGTDAALLTAKVIENAFVVLAIELIAMCQAADFLEVTGKLSDFSREIFEKIRKVFPKIKEDRVMTQELQKVLELLYHI